ncbi:alkene reductase [Ferrimonas futtsuensis]|uniref:alkene reductase n=1 Tax=Ferrimonas futtsuensis TaxID=364764 RepID=UPI00040A144D|nr:alkene reductase [Ferrimonas futtsuensis]
MIFTPFMLGSLPLANRFVMAPMTRARTDQPGDRPSELMVKYYGQRAGAGLIITEGAPISTVARGYSLTPGIYTQAQIDGWKRVTDEVHAKGGKIFIQLWHVGRRSHASIAGEQPVSPSALKVPDRVYGPLPQGGFGMIETGEPRAMTQEDIDATIADFTQAAVNAMEAGFDGVELHGAHGYLLEQFLCRSSNQRSDCYGGGQENRLRFLLEVIKAVTSAIGAERTALRLSPYVGGSGGLDPELPELTLKLVAALAPLGLAYLHLSEGGGNGTPDRFREQLRERYPRPIMVAGNYTLESGQAMLNRGLADLIAFGQPFITNPDLVRRCREGLALTPVDDAAQATFYGGGAEGYTDYPIA